MLILFFIHFELWSCRLNSVQHDNVNLKVAMDTLQASTANNTSSSEVENIIQRLHNDHEKVNTYAYLIYYPYIISYPL